MNNVDSYMNLILTDAEESNGSVALANDGKVVNSSHYKVVQLVAVGKWQKNGCSRLKA